MIVAHKENNTDAPYLSGTASKEVIRQYQIHTKIL